MIKVKKPSGWTYHTSEGYSAGYGYFGAATGKIILLSPQKEDITCGYVTLGAGLSVGISTASSSTKESFSAGTIYILSGFQGAELTLQDVTGYYLTLELSATAGIGGSYAALLLGFNSYESVVKEIALLAAEYGSGAGIGNVVKAIDAAGGRPVVTAGGLMEAVGTITGSPLNKAVTKSLGSAANKPLFDFTSSAKALLYTKGLSAGYSVSVGALGSIGNLWQTPEAKYAPHSMISLVHLHHTPGPKQIRVIFPNDLLFDFSKDDLKPIGLNQLKATLDSIKTKPFSSVRLVGHTDNIGGDKYNIDLSKRRAVNLAKWLVEKQYVKSENVKCEGVGKAKPAASNRDSNGRARNRRVEIEIGL